MHNIAYVLKKYSSVRVLFIVAISLAMAVLVGSGLHPVGSNAQPDFFPAPARAQQPTTQTGPAAASRSSLDNVSALDLALKNMGTLERDRSSASTGAVAQSNGAATLSPAVSVSEPPVKSLADTDKTGNTTLKNNINAVPNK